jgi:hypothetical protein
LTVPGKSNEGALLPTSWAVALLIDTVSAETIRPIAKLRETILMPFPRESADTSG